MTRNILLAFGLYACACGQSLAPSATRAQVSDPTQIEAAPSETPARIDSIALQRAPHFGMTEVVLDPHGEAALTLDRRGGVRLWPAIRTEDAPTPWVLPIQEPTWMSLAPAGEHAFVVAHVDATGGAHVGRVEIADDGAQYVPLFEVPPSDPLFELCVLDGGERILALGIDHRVRLYDSAGELLSVIDERRFVPWQLRVVQTPGQPPAIAAVLARPTRAQRIVLDGNELSLAGEPHMVALDQSPNRNDLELAPDGHTIGALRRPKHRGTTWWLELIDLDTGKRRKITGDADENVRPRMHLLDGDRALLHAGSGLGQRVDLAAARSVTIGEEPPPPSEFVAAIEAVEVPGSLGESRMQTTVAAGLRAVVDDVQLIADPIDEPALFTHKGQPFHPQIGAVAPGGKWTAWAASREVYLEERGGALRKVVDAEDTIVLLAFIDAERFLVVTRDGGATIRSGPDGVISTQTRVPVRPDDLDIAWDGDDEGAGTLAMVDRHRVMHAIAVRDGAFTGLTADAGPGAALLGVGEGEAAALLRDAGVDVKSDILHAIDDDGRHYLASTGRRPTLHRIDGDTAEQLPLRPGLVERLFVFGDLVAVVQQLPDENLRDLDMPMTLTVYDGASSKRLWTRPVIAAPVAFASGGTELALTDRNGGVVVDARTGETRRRRDHH